MTLRYAHTALLRINIIILASALMIAGSTAHAMKPPKGARYMGDPLLQQQENQRAADEQRMKEAAGKVVQAYECCCKWDYCKWICCYCGPAIQ